MHPLFSCPKVSFSSIQSALDIPANTVESWIVRAIGAKLIEGKIDQVGRGVVDTSPLLCCFRIHFAEEPSVLELEGLAVVHCRVER